MMLIDMNQVMIANFMAAVGNHTNIKIEEDLLRHMVLNSLRAYNHRFRAEYGEMIIACDDKRSWRKQIFPYYKANRKKDRDKSEIDWNSVFVVLEKVKDELRENFPYRVIQVETAEADDVIGTICKAKGAYLGDGECKILIISGDKDFKQLQKYTNVRQYDPVRKRWISETRPDLYLKEHIMRGDRGDGVPNFLSSGDVFVSNGRQKPLMQKKIDLWLKQELHEFVDNDDLKRYYTRNEAMIDLDFIPQDVQDKIMESFEAQADRPKDRSKLFNYFIEMNLKHLMTDISQF